MEVSNIGTSEVIYFSLQRSQSGTSEDLLTILHIIIYSQVYQFIHNRSTFRLVGMQQFLIIVLFPLALHFIANSVVQVQNNDISIVLGVREDLRNQLLSLC